MSKKKKKHTQNQEEKINAKEVLAAYEELDRVREKYPEIAAEVNPRYGKKTLMERLMEFYLAIQKRFHVETKVNRKVYLWLHLLGIFGVHHFYARHWIKGLLYLSICWSGIGVAMTLIDWMAAFPKQADENGQITV